jgi:hypothetical protein
VVEYLYFLLGEKEQNYKIHRAVALCIARERETGNLKINT